MKIFVTDREGNKYTLEGDSGDTLMEVIRDNSLDIEAACGGCCACATCHVYIEDEWLEKLSARDDDEESMLDQAFDVKNTSRLSCQISLTDDLDGLKLELATE
ncbi:MAG: 2Fe-2S iron-sulfur cluster binding domain-containing protein [Pelagibacteraceae bacterium]|jgi:2Fe-2S ferredoxin|nr:2Fe-2S iron-sulfur cluster binding domain-containing protein [Pelagibacteraceae bacterium]MBT3903002.1 2Fe-2S iron-sulfur cluster binding domain-containing protein [Pelagibacteraceae bacterium]MBT4645879.1 2Fe-2S iron-sulfur cluster binding domain-containing protein [Pelagibacteraceae bacterium]MBT4950267.1 2Fe-2S iron-sulfur cluster binding domain-containing protein [Pelagibacteraceae bacterium]MBT6353748.1 2Fe-2S iron-sulfur cluster binding domain-containing protein [Pelagibacteraceae bact